MSVSLKQSDVNSVYFGFNNLLSTFALKKSTSTVTYFLRDLGQQLIAH